MRKLIVLTVAVFLLLPARLQTAPTKSALQVVVLIAAAVLRGAELDVSASGIAWFVAAAALLTVAMYGVAETVANRMPSVEEYIAAVPGLAIVPFFFAGALFPITAMPRALAGFARVLPATHALALMRYGLLGGNASSLHDIWGMHNATAMAALSLAVVAVFATGLTFAALRTFRRAAVS